MLFLSLLLSLLGKLISRKPLWHNELQTHHPSEKCLNPSKKCLFPSEKCLTDKTTRQRQKPLNTLRIQRLIPLLVVRTERVYQQVSYLITRLFPAFIFLQGAIQSYTLSLQLLPLYQVSEK